MHGIVHVAGGGVSTAKFDEFGSLVAGFFKQFTLGGLEDGFVRFFHIAGGNFIVGCVYGVAILFDEDNFVFFGKGGDDGDIGFFGGVVIFNNVTIRLLGLIMADSQKGVFDKIT